MFALEYGSIVVSDWIVSSTQLCYLIQFQFVLLCWVWFGRNHVWSHVSICFAQKILCSSVPLKVWCLGAGLENAMAATSRYLRLYLIYSWHSILRLSVSTNQACISAYVRIDEERLSEGKLATTFASHTKRNSPIIHPLVGSAISWTTLFYWSNPRRICRHSFLSFTSF